MDRRSLREFTHKAANFLHVENDTYKQWVFRFTFLELEKDLGLRGDLTSESVFPEERMAKARVYAKADGIFAGRKEIEYYLVQADVKFRPRLRGDFKLDFKVSDGDELKVGDVILELEAELHDLLAVERSVLNLMMRMSGVATYTRRIVDLVKDFNVLITPTRKCLWGLLDKRAVVIGGGGTHRLNLADAILIKDNHAALMDHDYVRIFQNVADSATDARFVEIEVTGVENSLEVARILSSFVGEKKINSVGVLLMDNMGAENITEAMDLMRSEGLYEDLLFEASGGINEKTVVEFAKTGVDIISMGCITNSASSLDMSMKIVQ